MCTHHQWKKHFWHWFHGRIRWCHHNLALLLLSTASSGGTGKTLSHHARSRWTAKIFNYGPKQALDEEREHKTTNTSSVALANLITKGSLPTEVRPLNLRTFLPGHSQVQQSGGKSVQWTLTNRLARQTLSCQAQIMMGMAITSCAQCLLYVLQCL
jgi:hypothetical protein